MDINILKCIWIQNTWQKAIELQTQNEKVLKYLIITQENVNIFQIHFKYSHLKNFTNFYHV